MKLSTLLFILLLFFVSLHTFGQTKFYVGVETSFVQDEYLIQDEGDALSDPSINSIGLPGTTFLFGYQFHPIFSIEAGFATRPAKTGYSMTFEDRASASESSSTYYHIPVRVRASVPLVGTWLYGTSSLGIQFGTTDFSEKGTKSAHGSAEGKIGPDQEVYYSEQSTFYDYNRKFLSISAEIGLEFRIGSRFNIYTTMGYNKGFADLHRTEVQYKYYNQSIRNASVSHDGSYISANFGLRYRF